MTEKQNPNPYQAPKKYTPDENLAKEGRQPGVLAWIAALVLVIPTFIFGFCLTCIGSAIAIDWIRPIGFNIHDWSFGATIFVSFIGGLTLAILVFRIFLKQP
jgi:hypothetical protein